MIGPVVERYYSHSHRQACGQGSARATIGKERMAPLKFGLISPFGEARFTAELAYAAECAGWDGLFVGEAIWHNDTWVALTAAAMRTERIRLGTMLSPLPVMQPWKLAAESASLDNLSNGRVILSLGMEIGRASCRER